MGARIDLFNGAGAAFTQMLRHYLTTPDAERVVVGVAENHNGACSMVWSAIEDFESEV